LINSTAEEVFQTQTQLHAVARPRQILILNNYVYSQNRLLNYLFGEYKKKVEFLAAM